MAGVVSKLFISLFLVPAVFIALASAQAPSPTPQIIESDLVHYGDLIDVDFVGDLEFDWRGTLSTDGTLYGFPVYDGQIQALCRSEVEIAADITKSYKKILRDPKVVVTIVDRSNRALATIDGAVRQAQRFQIKRVVDLRELLVIAGGVTDEASGEITIFRPDNLSCADRLTDRRVADLTPSVFERSNQARSLNIKISELLSGKTESNPTILSGDIITVRKAVPIYVIGAVSNPRQVYSRSEITVSRAIAASGGLAKEAVSDKATIFRREGEKLKIIEIDLVKIKNGTAEDVVLVPFDIIEVPRKGGEKRKYPPLITAGESKNRNSALPPLRIID